MKKVKDKIVGLKKDIREFKDREKNMKDFKALKKKSLEKK